MGSNAVWRWKSYMSAVRRNLACSAIEPEPSYTIEMSPPLPWPKDGKISLEYVSFSYSREGPRVLKDISFTVNPGEKFGIAGRPGSNVNALFRMPECGGKITVDGVGISNLELQASRRGISVITKEPTLFMDSLGMNVDPSVNQTHKEVCEVLEKCHLKTWVECLPKQLHQDFVDCSAALGPSE
ncbi:multidrug resistance-associated protein 5-like [Montipora capricornis]|uniref:multidrug resistance-associated protein 5-like n=1 Tax=Montipora capricornis TaxID=246305 RepID=UPI0035F12E12